MNESVNLNTTFMVSKNVGMAENVLARLVPIDRAHANSVGIGQRALIANPGCKLLFPDSVGQYDLSATRRRGNTSLLHLCWMEYIGRQAIEYRVGLFDIEIPIVVNRGYNVDAHSAESVSYNLRCRVRIDSAESFFTEFALSQSTPEITVEAVQDSLSKSAITILGNEVSPMGTINPRVLYAMLNGVGLYLKGVPVIINYHNDYADYLKSLYEEHVARETEIRDRRSHYRTDAARRGRDDIAKLIVSLSGLGLTQGEIDKRVVDYRKASYDSVLAHDNACDNELREENARYEEAVRKVGYNQLNRPDYGTLPGRSSYNRNYIGSAAQASCNIRGDNQRRNYGGGYQGNHRAPSVDWHSLNRVHCDPDNWDPMDD